MLSEVIRTFPNIFVTLLKISKDCLEDLRRPFTRVDTFFSKGRTVVSFRYREISLVTNRNENSSRIFVDFLFALRTIAWNVDKLSFWRPKFRRNFVRKFANTKKEIRHYFCTCHNTVQSTAILLFAMVAISVGHLSLFKTNFNWRGYYPISIDNDIYPQIKLMNFFILVTSLFDNVLIS